MADVLKIYQRILEEIPAAWFAPGKLKQQGIPIDMYDADGNLVESSAHGGNSSNIGAILWSAARAIARLTDAADWLFQRVRVRTATGADLVLHYKYRYGFDKLPGETEAEYKARVPAEIFAAKKTRKVIRDTIEAVLGVPPVDIVEGALDSWWWDVSHFDTHHVTREGRDDMVVKIQGPLTDAQKKSLCGALRRVMPGINLLIEEVV